MNKYSLAFDIGGLFIKAAVLNARGEICKDTVAIYPSRAKDSKEELLKHFVFLIMQQTNKIIDKRFQIDGIGFAFPGPFDYENGVCYIHGVDKYDHIYGVNLRTELMILLKQRTHFFSKTTLDFSIMFDNDANLFALGELLYGNASAYEKSIYITIGTGTGSAFIERGELIKNRHDVPEHGWIYCKPFRDSIVDDYISKRGILKLAAELNVDRDLDIKEMAELARKGESRTSIVFHQFGKILAEMMIPFIHNFRPQALIIGGQIAKSGDLFKSVLMEGLKEENVVIEFVDRTSDSTFIGVAKLLQKPQSS